MTDEEIRAKLLKLWQRDPEMLAVHCGEQGLAVGCPVCGRRWAESAVDRLGRLGEDEGRTPA
jgi:hypothetical protein